MQAISQINPALNFMSGPIAAPTPLADGPFHGVPLLLKEGHGCAGQPLAQGSRLCSGLTAPADSEFVRRLKRSGVDILGSTTAPEFGIYNVTESSLHGATRNPWQLDHSPGGSSGGASAAVAARVVPVASSSDGGGSIRGPAHCTGTFGLKPSRARTPCGGKGDGGLLPFGHFHVTTRSVRDSAAFLDALHGAEPGARYHVPPPQRPFVDEVGAPTGALRIAVMRASPLSLPLHPQCRAAIDDAAALCAELGHEIEDAQPACDWEATMSAFLNAWICVLPHSLSAIERATGRRVGPDTLEPMTLKALEAASRLGIGDLFAADAVFQVARRSVDLFFEKYDVWLTPAGVTPAPRIGQFDPRRTDETMESFGRRSLDEYSAFTPLLNITGHPAASVPLHHGPDGLPVGVQIITRMGDEATLLRLAAQWEQARPWAARRPPVCAGMERA
ncbi:MAG: amidase [Sinimarinibacterium flocculans]|uniref:amidase n=1 Tax=Sinimarinibacterium flocculans TaxID=985250 RepID=UPI003C4922B1